MSTVILWYGVVGASALALTLLYLKLNRTPPPAKPEKPPRWHSRFDDVV